MAEEAKQEKAGGKNILSTIFKVILGLVLLVLGIWAIITWRRDLLTVIKGCVGGFLILAGIITLAIAKD